MYIYLFIGIIISFLLGAFMLSSLTCKSTQGNVIFLDGSQTVSFLQKDEDRYVHSLHAADLYARKVKSCEEYIEKISKLIQFSDKEKAKLRRCCSKADDFLKTFTYMGIDCKIIANMSWNLALIDTAYEEGLPHTRRNIIFLSKYNINETISADSNDQRLVSTLIHEKVHVFQRYNTQLMEQLIYKMGYQEVMKSSINSQDLKLKRSNPDINNKIYMTSDKEVLMITYKSDKPSGINDIKPVASFAFEHPYEKMAYEIAGNYDKSQWKLMNI